MKLGVSAWIVIALVVVLGGWFGIIRPMGLDKKMASTTSHAATNTKVAKIDGKTPIRICINTWCGFAPGIYKNNGFKPTAESGFTKDGVPVQFFLVDDFDAARAGFKSGQFDLLWTTVDTYPTEVTALNEVGAKVFMQVDFSDGGDVIVTKSEIKSVNDLRGKTIALAIPSPSSALLINVLKTAGLTMEDITVVKTNDEPTALAMFKARKVDAAVLWSPDDGDAVASYGKDENKNPRAHVLKSTKGTQIIADAFYAKADFIDSHRAQLQIFAADWFKAAAELNSSPDARAKAAKILALNFSGVDEAFCAAGISNAHMSNLGENANFFGLNSNYTGVTGENLYYTTGEDYAAINLAPKVLPAWKNVIDTSILRALQDAGTLAGTDQMATGSPKFTPPSPSLATAPAFSTRRVTVNFASNSAVLDGNAQSVIDREVSDMAKRFRGMRLRIEGNTDNVGSAAINKPLSYRRAAAVADYLVTTYHFDPNRFIKVGNGSKHPVDPNIDNDTPEARAANRRTDFQLIEDAAQ